MDIKSAREEKNRQKLFYPVIVLSDIHLFKTVAQADLLLEFLSNTDCHTLVLNGDIIDGWRMKAKKHRKFPEMHARILDAINAKAARGIKVVYIPGNHDEALRAGWKNKRWKKDGQGRPTHPFLNRTHVFTDRGRTVSAPIHFANGYRYTDPRGQRILFLHGDQFDPARLKSKQGRKLSLVGDFAYDGLIRINGYAIHVGKKFLKKHFSIAAYIKKHTKKTLGIIENFERAVAKSVKSGKIDAIAAGHIHHAEIRDIDGAVYMNSGDWVESASALVMDAAGKWEVLQWAEKRKEFGLTALPAESDENEFAAYRGITERQLRAAQWIWPAKNRKKILKQLAHQHKAVAGLTGAIMKPPQDFDLDAAEGRPNPDVNGLVRILKAAQPT